MSKVRQPESRQFYCYVLLDPRKPGDFDYGPRRHFKFEPFYVGKGKEGRSKCHLRLAKNSTVKNYKLNKIRKLLSLGLEPIVVRTRTLTTEARAFEVERELIEAIGRIDLGTGPLTNLTDGGDGPSGYKVPEKDRPKLREKYTDDVRERMRRSQAIRFSLETAEEARNRAAKAKATLQADPEIEIKRRAAIAQYSRSTLVRKKKSECSKAQWLNLSEEERRDRVNKQRAGWAAMSAAAREEFSRKCSAGLKRGWETRRRKAAQKNSQRAGLFF